MKKTLYTALSIFAVLIMVFAAAAPCFASSSKMIIQADKVTAKPGDQVDIKIKLTNNASISSCKVTVVYPETLIYKNAVIDIYDPEDDSAFKGVKENDNYIILNWLSALKDVKGDVTFATVTFEVAQNAKDVNEIKLYTDPEDIFGINMDNISHEVVYGAVYVENAETNPVSTSPVITQSENTGSEPEGFVTDITTAGEEISGTEDITAQETPANLTDEVGKSDTQAPISDTASSHTEIEESDAETRSADAGADGKGGSGPSEWLFIIIAIVAAVGAAIGFTVYIVKSKHKK